MPDLFTIALAGLGLAICVYLWWLHRQAERDKLQVVPFADLWGEPDHQAIGKGAQTVTLCWLLRAVLCGAILAALAGLVWPGGPRAQTVWVDVTPSLATQEAEGDRIDLAAGAISDALQLAGVQQVRVRAIQDPTALSPPIDVAAPGIARELRGLSLRVQPAATPPQVPGTARWVFTDGTQGARIAEFLPSAATVIAAGQETENAGLTALSVRRSLRDPDRLVVLVEARNAGQQPDPRRLLLHDGGREAGQQQITPGPGETTLAVFRISANFDGPLTASLSPPDALPSDDELTLRLRAADLFTPVTLAETCGPGFHAAIRAMRRIQITEAADAIAIDCGDAPDPGAALRLWIGPGVPVTAPPVWSEAAGEDLMRIALADLPLSARAAGPAPDAHLPILRAGTQILATAGPGGVDFFADLSIAALQNDPRFPVLLRALIERATTEPAKAHHRVARAPELLTVAPTNVKRPGVSAGNPPPLKTSQSLAWVFILLAAALLLADMARQRFHGAQ